MISSTSFTGQSWNELIASLPNPHLLQTWEWAQVKAKYGWQAMPIVWLQGPGGDKITSSMIQDKPSRGLPVAAAMVLKRTIPIQGFAKKISVLYVPKGPLLDWKDDKVRQNVLDDLQSLSKKEGAIFIKMDPDLVLASGNPNNQDDNLDPTGQAVQSELEQRAWIFSQDQIQFRNTVMINLSPSEEELIMHMKQKTRYNIRLAEKKGVTVRIGSTADLPLLYRMYAETSVRDGFVIRDEAYYQTIWQSFLRTASTASFPSTVPYALPLIAEFESQPIAAIVVFFFAERSYYINGMSREAHREKMPNYLLQWESIRLGKAAGCKQYDLWGAPDEFNENDGMWGVFRFKEGLGGQVVRTLGAWDFTPHPLLYRLYTEILPKILDIMRTRGKQHTRQTLD